ncbi:MAG TPA: amidase [Steroidobacteraceae bacterium]|jgi:aspartyl-tRNA(Asn)/glutamyl-tRNA(Gln) amidotransferase subunit A
MQVTRREFAALAAVSAAAQLMSRGVSAKSKSSEAPASELCFLTLTEAAAKVRSGELTATSLVQGCLDRIGLYGPKLDAFISVMKENALAQATQLDAESKAGRFRGPLHGVPIAIKDNIDTAGVRTTGGSAVFEDRVPEGDAPVVARLKAAGAVIIGKTNLQEFAMGGGETSFWGPARNPWNLAHNTGGSSSGSGAAVCSGLAYGALGTDTGGSVRMPASYCGIVGLKPTYGLVPIRGIIPLTLSLDHCGPMTRTVADTALMLGVMAGYDKLDITSVEHPKEDYVAALSQPVSGLRLGIPAGYFDAVQPEVAQAVQAAIELLRHMTAGARDVSLPGITHLANLGGLGETFAWHQQYFEHAAAKYMLPERRRLETAAATPAKAVDYIRAKWELETLRRTIDDAFTDFDLVVLPTQRIVAPTLNELIARAHDSKPIDPLVTSNCQPFDVFGIPAVSIPCGFSTSGLPIGLMIAGPRFSEGKVLALAQAYEKATQWHLRRPPLTPQTPVPAVATT